MVKIDLITGFLGAGKTTFLKKYANYYIDLGLNICILENDFGAVNVDMMLLDNINCDKEMVSGAFDYDCHFRRFKTKLISMAMRGYDRVLVEPSGLFQTDEFFDALSEEPLNSFYEIGNIFCIYDIHTKDLSNEAKSYLASMVASAGKLIVTKREDNKPLDINYLNQILLEFNSDRLIGENDVLYKDNIQIKDIINVGYHVPSTKRLFVNDKTFDSIYFLDKGFNLNIIEEIANTIYNDNSYGNIVRLKGFIHDNDKWYRINITKNEKDISLIENGQDVFIIIGEEINKDKINALIESIN
jgi:G3E family GTPase